MLQDYYHLEYKTGRPLREAVTLEYNRGKSFASLATERMSDRELVTSPVRELELKGLNLPRWTTLISIPRWGSAT